MKSVIVIMMLVSRFCVKVSDFAVDDRGVNIQEGNGCERVIAREPYSGNSYY